MLGTIAVVASLLQGCADYWFVIGHLKDNPIDQSLTRGASIRKTRAALRKAFPPGRPVAEVRRELERIGAHCTVAPTGEAKVVCHYTQWTAIEYRHPFGRSPHSRDDYRFQIELLEDRGRLRDFAVCIQDTVTFYEWGRIKKTEVHPPWCKDVSDLSETEGD